jgi:hypothetical protein
VIRISVEVARGAARFRVAVQAQSIERTLEIVEGQNPRCQAKVTIPIDPEVFFVRGAAAIAGPVVREAA